jgi:hypothetical protein
MFTGGEPAESRNCLHTEAKDRDGPRTKEEPAMKSYFDVFATVLVVLTCGIAVLSAAVATLIAAV